jgi:peptidoglycan/xylan/chitin deacetylase (PgdA/CDA1 family)
MTRQLAVNVDVDSLDLYYGIHGLDPERATDASWVVGVPRFLELFDRLGLKATFFVVGKDLERDGPYKVARTVVKAGHELASHTWSHPYDLIRQSHEQIVDEISRVEAPLADLRGRRVNGFRAPGYNVSDEVLQCLADRGYLYDSSLFPCPAYYLARATAIGSMALRGRQSQSIVGNWRAPFSSRVPHKRRHGGAATLMEYPMCVLPVLRLPVIGTSITMMGSSGVSFIRPFLRRMSFVNLEFHALDLLDQNDLGGSELVAHQFDLRVEVSTKTALFSEVLKTASEKAHNDTLENLTMS